jgi:hypothetical protein
MSGCPKGEILRLYRAVKLPFFHIRCDAEQEFARKAIELMQMGTYAANRSGTGFPAQLFAICTSCKEA